MYYEINTLKCVLHISFGYLFGVICFSLIRFKSLYVSRKRVTIDLFPTKPQMAAILDLFFNGTLKFTDSFKNEFSIKNHVKRRYYIKIYVK